MDSGVKRSSLQCRLADGTKKWYAFDCTEHSDEPLKAKIVFSIGFHDFRVSSPSYKSHLHNILLQSANRHCREDLLTPESYMAKKRDAFASPLIILTSL